MCAQTPHSCSHTSPHCPRHTVARHTCAYDRISASSSWPTRLHPSFPKPPHRGPAPFGQTSALRATPPTWAVSSPGPLRQRSALLALLLPSCLSILRCSNNSQFKPTPPSLSRFPVTWKLPRAHTPGTGILSKVGTGSTPESVVGVQ